MANYTEARKKIALWEGGYSPGFPGSGETYKGIDRIYNPTWAGWAIIDKIPNKKQGQFFKNPTLDKLVEDYVISKYWNPSRAAEIVNDQLSIFYFDFYYHKPLQARMAANLAVKEISPTISTDNKRLTDAVVQVMNSNPEQVYKRMYQLRELHYLNKWANNVTSPATIYKTSQKGVLNRLYSFMSELEKKNRNRIWNFNFSVSGHDVLF